MQNFTISPDLTAYFEARFPEASDGALARIRSRVEAGEDELVVVAEVDDQVRLALVRRLGEERASRKIDGGIREWMEVNGGGLDARV